MQWYGKKLGRQEARRIFIILFFTFGLISPGYDAGLYICYSVSANMDSVK